MTAVSAEENSLSSKRSWNLKAELSSICLNAGGAETALGSIKAASVGGLFHSVFGLRLTLQNPRLLDHAREIRDRLFVDDRRLRLSRRPDLRQVVTG